MQNSDCKQIWFSRNKFYQKRSINPQFPRTVLNLNCPERPWVDFFKRQDQPIWFSSLVHSIQRSRKSWWKCVVFANVHKSLGDHCHCGYGICLRCQRILGLSRKKGTMPSSVVMLCTIHSCRLWSATNQARVNSNFNWLAFNFQVESINYLEC